MMAENKKSFLLYCDLIHTVKELPDDKAGELFKHILSYVNDENPVTNDLIIKISFEPIKQQLKRDLQKYEGIRERNAANARKRWDAKNATASDRIPNSTKNADSDNDTDIDTDIDIDNKEKSFRNAVSKHSKYSSDMLDSFADYWTEKKPKGRKMKFEFQKTFDISRRLKTWANNDFGKKEEKETVDFSNQNLYK